MRYRVRLTPRALPQFLVSRDGLVTHSTYKLTWALGETVPKVMARLARVHAEVVVESATIVPTRHTIWHTEEEDTDV